MSWSGLMVAAVVMSGGEPCELPSLAKILADDGDNGDRFGASVCIVGDTAVVGTPNDDDFGSRSGSAYVFERIGDAWTQTAKLLADDGTGGDQFGQSVWTSGDTIVVGALGWESDGVDSGAAFVFERDGDGWTQAARLVPPGGADGDQFGWSVGISGDSLIVSSPGDDDRGGNSGSIYVYRRIDGVWTQSAKLVGFDARESDNIGAAASISGNTLLAGSYIGGSGGVVYAFERIAGQWFSLGKLEKPDGSLRFGFRVRVAGDVAVVGDPFNEDPKWGRLGAAIVYERGKAGWDHVTTLCASDAAQQDFLGWGVGLRGHTIIAGAPGRDDAGEGTGAAYRFERLDGTWTETGKLLASDGEGGDWFGVAVDVSGRSVLVGAFDDVVDEVEVGSAHVFESFKDCPGDLDGDGLIGFGDLVALLASWGAGCDTADLDRDGDTGLDDLLLLLASWGDCPRGACCVDADACEMLPLVACVEAGGFYRGDGTSCADGCVAGACCAPDDTCTLAVAGTCARDGGFYAGDGTSCEDACVLGACCLPDGTCKRADEAACILIGGFYRGDGTSCDDACAAGACCFADGSCGVTIEQICTLDGGFYQGDGSSCDDCPAMGACCYADGTCARQPESVCVAAGGIFQGDGSSCDDACDPIGADACNDAPELAAGVYPYSTMDSTHSSPFELPEECDEGRGREFRFDIWVAFVAPADGVLTASVCASTFNTRLAAYTPGDLGCPGDVLACNDDACGAQGSRSEMSLAVEAGEKYLVRIGSGRTSSRGTGLLSLTFD